MILRTVVLPFFLLGSFAMPADAIPDRRAGCGGFPLPYGTSIGTAGPSRTQQHVSSIIAVAAVVPADGSDLRPRAWMVWDERGLARLALKKDSPRDLKRLWLFRDAPNFSANGNALQVRFTPIRSALPASYVLTPCSDADNRR